jgi:outer membrane protein OmpA-like peptidoglycan-associated protein
LPVEERISPTRIETRGYGKPNPVADNSTKLGCRQNRRVEVKELK